MTPFLLSEICAAAQQKKTAEIQMDRWLVWHTAALQRVKKMPTLSDFLGEEKKSMTASEFVEYLRAKKA